MEAWSAGASSGPEEQVQAFTLTQLLDLSAADVRRFYGIEDKGDGDTAQD
jgi:hypothetical protein